MGCPPYVGYRLAQWVSIRMPPRDAFRCAERLADGWQYWSRRDRAAVQTNLSLILGEPVSGHAPVVRETFRHFARYVIEFFASHRVTHPEVRLEGEAHLRQAVAQRRGAIILSAHLGNWELGAMVLRRMGFDVSIVALPHQDPAMDRLFNRQRERCGLEVIPLGKDATRLSLLRLRAGYLLGVLGDREFGRNGIRLPLAGGQEVTLPRGPAILSLRSRSPVVPVFFLREGPWSFRFCFEPPIWPEPGRHDARALTTRYLEVIERYIRRCPSQWLMFRPATSS